MVWFLFFVGYSFLRFLLEVAYARATRAARQDRKCFLVLPLCPVYGLGALAILSLPRTVREAPLLLALWGGLAATVTEYAMAVVYEKGFGVSFWDYSKRAGNRQGRVCPAFSLIWGLLALGLVYWVHPVVKGLADRVPPGLALAAAVLVAADGFCTAVLLRRTRSTHSLRWYDSVQKPAAG